MIGVTMSLAITVQHYVRMTSHISGQDIHQTSYIAKLYPVILQCIRPSDSNNAAVNHLVLIILSNLTLNHVHNCTVLLVLLNNSEKLERLFSDDELLIKSNVMDIDSLVREGNLLKK